MKEKAEKKKFDMPEIEIIVFIAEDILKISGGFDGQWDQELPEYDF